MTAEQLKCIIEAALMAADTPLSVPQLLALFEGDPEPPAKEQIRAALDELAQDFADRGVELAEVASGYRFQVRNEYAPWVNRLQEERPQRYSRALMETLAIIAYRQPITRGEIEDIRGVSISGGIVRTLLEREWVRVVGHRDVPGKPELLATTRQFLDYFNLRKLSDLPPLSEIKDYDAINPDLFESLGPETEVGNTDADMTVTVDQDEDETGTETVAGEMLPEDDLEEEALPAEGNVVPFSGHS